MLPYCSPQLWTRKLYLNRNQAEEYYKLGQDEQDAWLNIRKININPSKYNMESWHKTLLNYKQRKYIHRSWERVKIFSEQIPVKSQDFLFARLWKIWPGWMEIFLLPANKLSVKFDDVWTWITSHFWFLSKVDQTWKLTAHAALLPFISKRDNF